MLCLVLLAAGCGGGSEEATGRTGADLTRGKELFTSGCAQCHVLADAGANGRVGPNLDDAFGYSREQGFEDSTFYEVVLSQIDIPAEGGGMPADIYAGQDAVDVAGYVASVAGAEPDEGDTGGGPPPPEAPPAETEAGESGEVSGKEVFALSEEEIRAVADYVSSVAGSS